MSQQTRDHAAERANHDAIKKARSHYHIKDEAQEDLLNKIFVMAREGESLSSERVVLELSRLLTLQAEKRALASIIDQRGGVL